MRGGGYFIIHEGDVNSLFQSLFFYILLNHGPLIKSRNHDSDSATRRPWPHLLSEAAIKNYNIHMDSRDLQLKPKHPPSAAWRLYHSFPEEITQPYIIYEKKLFKSLHWNALNMYLVYNYSCEKCCHSVTANPLNYLFNELIHITMESYQGQVIIRISN